MPVENIETHYRIGFSNAQEMLLQDNGGKLDGTFMQGTVNGEGQSVVDQFGTIDPRLDDERYGDSPHMDLDRKRRWIYAESFDAGHLIDKKDVLRSVLDPTSAINKAIWNGMRRKRDDIRVSAFFGPARIGRKGDEVENFDTAGQVVGVQVGSSPAADTGFNVKKLQRARRKLLEAEIDLDTDELYAALTAEQEDNLWDEAKITHGDYVNGRPFEKGMLPPILGFKRFIHIERLPKTGNVRHNPVWVKSGMYFGVAEEVTSDVVIRNDKKLMPYAYARMTAGATRLENKKVVRVDSLEEA